MFDLDHREVFVRANRHNLALKGLSTRVGETYDDVYGAHHYMRIGDDISTLVNQEPRTRRRRVAGANVGLGDFDITELDEYLHDAVGHLVLYGSPIGHVVESDCLFLYTCYFLHAMSFAVSFFLSSPRRLHHAARLCHGRGRGLVR